MQTDLPDAEEIADDVLMKLLRALATDFRDNNVSLHPRSRAAVAAYLEQAAALIRSMKAEITTKTALANAAFVERTEARRREIEALSALTALRARVSEETPA